MQERCICCGAAIPEGRQICVVCERFGRPRLTAQQLACAVNKMAVKEDDKEEKHP